MLVAKTLMRILCSSSEGRGARVRGGGYISVTFRRGPVTAERLAEDIES